MLVMTTGTDLEIADPLYAGKFGRSAGERGASAGLRCVLAVARAVSPPAFEPPVRMRRRFAIPCSKSV